MALDGSSQGQEHVPPLPAPLLSVLARASLCYLATSEEGAPHLCLMAFSFLADAEDADAAGAGAAGAAGGSGCFILATKRATKKFRAIESNPRCALLVHDFATLREQAAHHAAAAAGGGAGAAGGGAPAAPPAAPPAAGTVSVTVYGDVEIVPEGPRAERLRALHAARSPSYAHFSAGEGVAMLAVRPSMARICDVQDRVQMWCGTAEGGGAGASSPRLAAAAERIQAAEAEAEQLRDFLLAAEERAGALAEELEARDAELAALRAEKAR